jgi:hypothetical protein
MLMGCAAADAIPAMNNAGMMLINRAARKAATASVDAAHDPSCGAALIQHRIHVAQSTLERHRLDRHDAELILSIMDDQIRSLMRLGYVTSEHTTWWD